MGEGGGNDREIDVQGRVSAFFMLIGIGLLILFYISDQLDKFNLWYFISGAAVLGFGWYLFVKRRRIPVQSQRFAGIRKLNAKIKASKEASARAKEERAKAKAEKQAKKDAKKRR